MAQTSFSDEEIQLIYNLIGDNVKHYRMQKEMSQLECPMKWAINPSALYPLLNSATMENTSILSTCTKSAKYSMSLSLNSSSLPPQNHRLNPINKKSLESFDQ
jgi:hypothetical protein